MVLAIVRLILIKEHSRLFYFRQAEWPESWTMFESMPLILTFFVPKHFKTSLKHTQINLVNLTAKRIISFFAKKFPNKVKKTRISH